jgi:hypothetical protein
MKKILLFIVFPLLLQSCLFEEKDYFEESASARIEGKIVETKSVLSSQDNGWILHYFPRLSLGGHNYTISFSDEQAKIACESEVVGNSVNTCTPVYFDSCLYDVISEQGAILSFNTYSKLMHQFRNPSAVAYQGHGGDYEFVITNVKSDEIKLKGKTNGNTMRMIPVPDGYTPKSYIEAVQTMVNNGKIGSYLLYSEGKLVDSTVTGIQKGRYLSYSYNVISLNEETKKNDTVTATANISVIYTPDGFIVYHDKTENAKKNVYPLKKSEELLPLFDPDIEYTEFIFDRANAKFVSKDGKIEFVKAPLGDLNTRIVGLMGNGLFEYYSATGSACSSFISLWTTAALYLNLSYGNQGVALSDISIGYDVIMTTDKYALTFWCGQYNATYGINIKPVEGTTNQISISAVAGNLNWAAFGTYLTPLVNFFVNYSPWIIEPDDEELPQTVKLVSAANSNMWIYLELYN